MKTRRFLVSVWLAGFLGWSGGVVAGGFPISSSTAGESDPDVSYNPQLNEFVVVWAEYGGGSWDIHGQRVATDGSLVAANFPITTAGSTQRFPAVASRTGQSLVVWVGPGDLSIEGQRINSTGGLVGGAFNIAGLVQSSHRWPDVAYSSGDDEYLVVWADDLGAGASWDVFGALVDPNTGNVGATISISTASNNQTQPQVAYNATDGQFMVVWSDARNGGTAKDIYGQRVGSDGALGGILVGVNTAISTALPDQYRPAVAYNGNSNRYEVVWQDYYNGLRHVIGQRVNATGSPVGPSVLIAGPPGTTNVSTRAWPDIAYGSAGNEFKVVWTATNELGDIHGQWLHEDGSLNGGNFIVCTAGWGQDQPAIAYAPRDNAFLAVWADNRPSTPDQDIYGEIEEGPDYRHKMHYPQLPDPDGWDVICMPPWTLADDFRCTSNGTITEIKFWGSWKGDIPGDVQMVHLSIHGDIPDPDGFGPQYSMPSNPPLWTYDVLQTEVTVSDPLYGDQGWLDPVQGPIRPDHQQYYEYVVDIPPDQGFTQQVGTIYWLDIQVTVEGMGPQWGWKTSLTNWNDDAVYDPGDGTWYELIDSYTSESLDMAFVINGVPTEEPEEEMDFGDAPEGALAYPSLGVNGAFPTCVIIGPATWIQHLIGQAFFGPTVDGETDGNAGLCPGCFPPYNSDECFQDGDAGLITPEPFTIQAGAVVPCPGSVGSPLGNTCQNAVWGANVDIQVVNNNNSPRYVNVLMDWDQNGAWGGSSFCPGGVQAFERVLTDFQVPAMWSGPLSNLMPPNFLIGPSSGYVWCRFTISDRQVGTHDWEGDEVFDDGETEDYLLWVEEEQEDLDYGDAPDGVVAPQYPTLLANDGARHGLSGIFMGAAIDIEPDGQPDPNALGDDQNLVYAGGTPWPPGDEDGVVFNTMPLIPGQMAQVTVSASLGGTFLSAWVDFNGDGSWAQFGDQVFDAQPMNAGPNVLIFPVPATATPGLTAFARFRLHTNPNPGMVTYTGYLPYGEVEDYMVTIGEEPVPPEEKWLQTPDLDVTGMDVDAQDPIILADDFLCTSNGVITNIVIWGSWTNDVVPIGDPRAVVFMVSFHADIPATNGLHSMPGEVLWWTNFQTLSYEVVEEASGIDEGWYDPSTTNYVFPGDHVCWRYSFAVDPADAFVQTGSAENPVVYWLDVQAHHPSTPNEYIRFGWKTSTNHWNDDAVWGLGAEPYGGPWYEMRYPPQHPWAGESIALAFELQTGEYEPPEDLDFGDAPEGALAYPSLGTMGAFPTCQNVPIAGWVQHGLGLGHFAAPGGVPQPPWDPEADGNAGLCPAFNPNLYNQDECVFDGDAGLLFPAAHTITGPVGSETVTICPNGTAGPLGTVCQNAAWGANVDIHVVNGMPATGYVNVLMDWDQNGVWGGAALCPAAGAAPEHVLVDFPVAILYSGALSSLAPPGFLIGPNSGYVWCRFTITPQPVGTGWDGSGSFEDGESEDYLLEVEGEQPENADWGDAPTNYPTLSAAGGASHVIGGGPGPGPKLGFNWGDMDPDGQPDPNALGDDNDVDGDDEDGVTIPRLVRGRMGSVAFSVAGGGAGGGWVELWIDFDGNGWDASEKLVNAWYLPGPHTIPVTVPANAQLGRTYARARINSVGAVGVGGQAIDGEVEDYEVFIIDQCPKWIQPPDCQFGLDMQSWTNSEAAGEGHIVADDWFCDGRPIAAIDWWGSYIDWEPNQGSDPPTVRPKGFELTWYTDVPAEKSDTGYSVPKVVLRTDYVTLLPYGSNALGKGKVSERIFCTNTLDYLAGAGVTQELEYAYHVDLEEPWLEKEGNIYWLSVQAVYENDPQPYPWGWKTTPVKWNWLDDAVHHKAGNAAPWEEMIWLPPIPPWDTLGGHPYEGESVNMAFRLLTDICPRRCKKWAQPPDMDKGVDMESWRHTDPIAPSYVLRADDFISDGRPITDIHWWGSYSNWYVWKPGSEADPVLAPTSFPWRPLGFQISWHTNALDSGSCTEPALPALYTNFVPMRYCHEVFYGTVTQDWRQPVPPALEYYEHEYQYYIDLLDPRVSGEPWLEKADGHYWLDIQAVFTNAFYPWIEDPVPGKHAGWGWKTTTNITGCVSMFSEAEGMPGSWQEAFRTEPAVTNVDLSFELTTTNVPPPGSTNNWLDEGPFQFTDMWLREVQVLSNGTPVGVDEWWLYSQGECGCGRQVLQLRSNLVEGIDWVDIATNYVPRPLNIWTVPYDEPVEFYRIRLEN